MCIQSTWSIISLPWMRSKRKNVTLHYRETFLCYSLLSTFITEMTSLFAVFTFIFVYALNSLYLIISWLLRKIQYCTVKSVYEYVTVGFFLISQRFVQNTVFNKFRQATSESIGNVLSRSLDTESIFSPLHTDTYTDLF